MLLFIIEEKKKIDPLEIVKNLCASFCDSNKKSLNPWHAEKHKRNQPIIFENKAINVDLLIYTAYVLLLMEMCVRQPLFYVLMYKESHRLRW